MPATENGVPAGRSSPPRRRRLISIPRRRNAPGMTSSLRFLAAAALGAICASSAHALPPSTAASYTGTYKQTVKTTEGGVPKTSSETTTIAVAKQRSRWERQRDKFVTIQDRGAKKMFAYGGEMPPDMAVESTLRPTPAWEFGYATIAAESKPPNEAGKETIAGQSCTVLEFDSERFGKPKLCVTEQGIVARFVLDDPEDGSVTTFEAEKITLGEPPAKTFELPAGRKLESMEPM
jgi:hypothetical protein